MPIWRREPNDPNKIFYNLCDFIILNKNKIQRLVAEENFFFFLITCKDQLSGKKIKGGTVKIYF